MEVTAAERTTIYTNISPLAQRVNNYIQTQHSSIAAVAKDIGYSRTTVSRYLTGKYDSNPNDLEQADGLPRPADGRGGRPDDAVGEARGQDVADARIL